MTITFSQAVSGFEKHDVSFTDDDGNPETVTSGATAVVALPAPRNVRAVTGKDSVDLTWDAPEDRTVTGCRVERRSSRQGRNIGRVFCERED